MRLFTRYLLWELFKSFAAALGALTVLLLVHGLYKEARDEGLGPAQIVRLVPFVLPEMLRYTIPATALFAVSSVYGRMSGSNEVVAIKSLGISPLAVLQPALIAGFLLSLLALWINDVALTWGQRGVRRVVLEAAEEIVYGVLRTQRSYSTKNFSINVKGVVGRRLLHPTFTFMPKGDSPALTVMAEEAELRTDADMLKILFRQGTVDVEGQLTYKTDTFEQQVPLASASQAGDEASLPPARLPMHMVPRRRAQIEELRETYQRRRAIETALPLLTGDMEPLLAFDWASEEFISGDWQIQLNRLATEPPRRWSDAFSCLCFILIGAPVAVWARNADFMTTFACCFGPILAAYYPLLLLGVEQAKSGAWHPWTVWLGNLVLATAGLLILWRKVLRH